MTKAELQEENRLLRKELEWGVSLCDAVDTTDRNDSDTSVMFREVLHDIRDNHNATLKRNRHD